MERLVRPATGLHRHAAGGRYRWAVLGVGTLAQGTSSAYFQGLAAVAPALRASEHLSVTSLGVLLGAPTAGLVVTLLPWGWLTDRVGERLVMAAGLLGAALALTAASAVHGLGPLAAWLFLAGASGASVNAASGRAVLTWFPGPQRGVAMGVRQTAVPLGAATAAVALPPLVAAFGVGGGLRALAVACLAAAAAVTVWIREPAPARRPGPGAATGRATASAPSATGAPPRSTRPVLHDRRLWRLAGASSLLVVPQFTLVAFTVEVLHEHRGVAAATAAGVLAAGQLSGAFGRLLVGSWSDRVGSRTRPLRLVALAMAAGAVVLAATVDGPLPLLEVALVAESLLVICWNGLAFTAAGELAPPGRVGTALAFQNTGNFVSATVTPPVMGLVISTAGYGPAFALLAVPAVLSARLLTRLPAST